MTRQPNDPTASRWNEVQRYLPFALSVALLLMMLWDALSAPFYGAASLITLIPAGLMVFMAWGVLISRAESTQACLLAVYLMALAVLARDSLTGVITFPHAAEPVPRGQGAFYIPELLWVLALGAAPLLYARHLAKETEASPSPMQTLRFLFGAFGFIVAQAALIYAASVYAPGFALMASAPRSTPSSHQILLLYSFPLVLLSYLIAFVLLIRVARSQREHERQASASFWIFFAGSKYLLFTVIELLTGNSLFGMIALLLAYAVPVISLYAIEHYSLFGIRLTLRRIVQYSLAKTTLTVMTTIPLIVAAFFIGNGFEWRRVDATGGMFLMTRDVSPLSAVSSLLLTALSGTLLLVRVPLLNWLDKTYFREVYDAQRVLNQMTRRLLHPSNPGEIGKITLQGIQDALHPKSALLLMQEDGGQIVVLAMRPDRDLVELADAALLNCDKMVSYPSSEQDAATLDFQNSLSLNACTLLREMEIRLILPIREDGVRAGLLLGAKDSGLDYTPEDCEMLAALMPQIALGLQNTLLTRETLRRRTSEMNQRSAGFVELVERERRLFAADLHDQTLPELRCLLTDLQALQSAPQDNTPQIAEMEDRLKQAIENVRDMMESLRPSALEMLGLIPALESELRKATGRMRPPLIPQFSVTDMAAAVGFPPFTEVLIFRIMQEAVNNACRHAQARHVRVVVDCENDCWRLAVEDDGNGLPPAETRRVGNGLANMQFRASLIGATLHWSVPESGVGTRVELCLPKEAQNKME